MFSPVLGRFEFDLADGRTVVVLQILDDCSRFDLALRAAPSENGEDVWAAVVHAGRYGLPAQFLTDNGTADRLIRHSAEGETPLWDVLRDPAGVRDPLAAARGGRTVTTCDPGSTRQPAGAERSRAMPITVGDCCGWGSTRGRTRSIHRFR